MNVRLQLSRSFMAGMIYNDQFWVNHYNVVLGMTTNSSSDINHNIALSRINYILYDVMQNSIFVESGNTDQITNLAACNAKICALPIDPYDQIIGMMLYCKLTAVLEDRIIVNDLDICSHRGDDVWFKHNQHESLGCFESEGWWHDTSPSVQTERRRDRVVSLQSAASWRDLDLLWEEDETSETDNEGMILTFRKDEN